MKNIPEIVKVLGRKIFNIRDRILAMYWGSVVRKNPQRHAVREVKRQKQILLRPVNIECPKYFSEKMLWLKYNLYNESPLIAQCYNKYEVRKYIRSKGLGYILNELYGVWDSIEEIEWDKLPNEYVMKVSNGYAGHVFKRSGESFSVKNAQKVLKKTKSKYNYYYNLTGDIFVGETKQYIICEKLIQSDLGYTSPEDYKFYCFNGKPLYLEFMFDREEGSKYNELFMDIEFSDRHDLEGESGIGDFKPPVCMPEMLAIAKKLSEDFPFVRVDLYVADNKPIFGELTFTPFHKQTEQSEVEMGDMLDLSNISNYKKILSKRV